MRLKTLFAFTLAAGLIPAHAQFRSVYTSAATQDCVIEDPSGLRNEIPYAVYECPGFGRYEVIYLGVEHDFRLTLRYSSDRDDLIELWRPPSLLAQLGSPKIEWRYEYVSKTPQYPDAKAVKYRALIYTANHVPDDAKEAVKTRVVVRLQGEASCVIGLIREGKQMNAQARKIADDSSRPCLKN